MTRVVPTSGFVSDALSVRTKIEPSILAHADKAHNRRRGYINGNFEDGIVYEGERQGAVSAVSFSPDGERLAVGGRDRKVVILSTSFWKIVKVIDWGVNVYAVNYSPDGKYLAVGGWDRKVSILSTSTWSIVNDVSCGGYIEALRFSNKGDYLAMGGWDDNVAIVSTHTWQIIHKIKRDGNVYSLSFSTSDKLLAIGGWDQKVAVFSASSWEIVKEVTRNSNVEAVCFSPDDKYLAIGDWDGIAAIVSTSSWETICEIQRGGYVKAISFSCDGYYFAIGGRDRKIAVLSTSAWEVIYEVEREDDINVVNFSGNGTHLAFGGVDWKISVALISHWYEIKELEGRGYVHAIAFNNSGNYMAVGGEGEHTSVVSTASWDVVNKIEKGEYVRSVCFSFDDALFAVGGTDSRVVIMSTTPWETVYSMERAGDVKVVAFCNNGNYFAVGGEDMICSIVSTLSWSILHEVEFEGNVESICFSPDGKYLVIGGEFESVVILTTSTWEILHEIDRGGNVYALSFSPDGQYLVMGGEDMTVAVVSTLTWHITNNIEGEGYVSSICFSFNGAYLALGWEKNVAILSTTTWKIVHEIIRDDYVSAVAFSRDGCYLATGGGDMKVTVVALGPLSTAQFAPLSQIMGDLTTSSSDDVDKIVMLRKLNPYCTCAPAVTLLQRCVYEKFDVLSIEKLIERCPKLLCAVNVLEVAADGDIFATAMRSNDPKLILMLLSCVFSQTGKSLACSNVSDILWKYQETIIVKYPEVWTKALKKMVLMPNPGYTTSQMECSATCFSMGASDFFSVPWNRSDIVESGEILAMVIPHQYLGSLSTLELTTYICSVDVMDNDIMGYVLEVMWRDHIKFYFFVDVGLFTIFCALWIWLQELAYESSSFTKTLVIWLVLVLNFFFCCKEVLSASLKPGSLSLIEVLVIHFRDKWNVVDFIALVMVFWSVGRVLGKHHESEPDLIMAAFTAFTLMLKYLSYMRGFDSTGWLITVLSQNLSDVKGFMIILLIILVGFSAIFRILLRTVDGACKLQLPEDDVSVSFVDEDCDMDPYSTYALAAFNVFNMGIMGDFDTDHFDGSDSPWASRFFFLLLVLIVTVVVLNALIALLGDSYSRIQEKSTANKNMERAKLIVEYLMLLPSSIRKNIANNTRFIHVLLPRQYLDENGHIDSGEGQEWEGSVNATRRAVETATSQLSVRLNGRLNDMDKKLEKVECQLECLQGVADQLLAALNKNEAL